MESFDKPKERVSNIEVLIFQPEVGVFYAFDHVKFYVGNAKQAASFYTTRFGFDYVAYQVRFNTC